MLLRRKLLPLTRAFPNEFNGRKVRIVADVVGAVAVQSIANLCRRRPTQVTREESTRPGAEVAGRFVGFDRRHVFSRCARKDRVVSDRTLSKVLLVRHIQGRGPAATALGLARGREQGQSFLRVHYCFRGLHVDRLMYFQGVRDRLSTLQGLQVLLRALS